MSDQPCHPYIAIRLKSFFLFCLYWSTYTRPRSNFQHLTRNFLRVGPCISLIFIHRQPLTCADSASSVMSISVWPYGLQPASLPSMGFSRQEYWSGLPCPSPGDLPDPGTEPRSIYLHWQAGSLPLTPPGKSQPLTWQCLKIQYIKCWL